MTTVLEHIRAREQAATPGPWVIQNDIFPDLYSLDDDSGMLGTLFEDADAAFISNSRADIPLLLAVAEAAAELSPGEWQTIRIALQKMRFTPDRVLAALDHIDAAIAPLMEETE